MVNRDVDSKLIHEQNEDIRHIEKDIADLAEVGKELNMLVVDQAEPLNQIEKAVVDTEEHVVEGHSHLADAAILACRARWKMLCIVLIAILIVVIVIVVIAVAVSLGAGLGGGGTGGKG